MHGRTMNFNFTPSLPGNAGRKRGGMKNRKGFESEYGANEFAKKVKGTVKFSPLPDYMGMIPYLIVTWEGKKE